MIYKKSPKCKICMNQNTVKIDRDLLNRVPYPDIVEKRQHLFDSTNPLTKTDVFNHWTHMKEAADTVAELVVNGTNLPATLMPGNIDQTPGSQRVFKELVHRRVDEIQIMEDLILSGIQDLKDLTPTDVDDIADDDADQKRLRNQVRKDTALITMDSAKVKQMAAQAAKEQEHVERGRLVFRLFAILRASVDPLPETFKGVVKDRLKQYLNNDHELKELLSIAQKDARTEVEEAEVVSVEEADAQ